MKKILMINGSPRKNGSGSTILGSITGLTDGKYSTERIDLSDLNIYHCKGCGACKKTGACVQKDDMTSLYPKIKDADMLVMTLPVYFGAECGLFKNFIDRFYAFIGYKDGKRTVDIGKSKKCAIIVVCNAPNGNMAYQGLIVRLIGTFKSLNIEDVSSAIIPSADPDTVLQSEFLRDYLTAFKMQISE